MYQAGILEQRAATGSRSECRGDGYWIPHMITSNSNQERFPNRTSVTSLLYCYAYHT